MSFGEGESVPTWQVMIGGWEINVHAPLTLPFKVFEGMEEKRWRFSAVKQIIVI